jgi:hypothetical protein
MHCVCCALFCADSYIQSYQLREVEAKNSDAQPTAGSGSGVGVEHSKDQDDDCIGDITGVGVVLANPEQSKHLETAVMKIKV